ncbi:hypothetical protein J7U46_13790 [Pelomonas sp. V22]|uniref:hypothetical protein n=1 Tax=Pelomonas sp. V22 TaxID=2822139 RepID=UPI0024A86885|nr:hypothetical protein [Pelomonas sp. V22]MDI4634125.1 hypothetical protein [Pelomonas sp. V22]
MTLHLTSRVPGRKPSRHGIGLGSRWLLCGLSLQLIAGCGQMQKVLPESAPPAPAVQDQRGPSVGTAPARPRVQPATPAPAAGGAPAEAPPATGSSWGDAAIKVAVCGAVAFGGAKIANRLVEWEAKTKPMSAKDKELKQRSYVVGFALLGCTIGVNLASKVLANLSEKARQAQNQAWYEAQQGASNKVQWSAPDASGSTELTDVQVSANGRSCGIRRDVIRSNQGEETAQVPVCKKPGEKEYTPTIQLG